MRLLEKNFSSFLRGFENFLNSLWRWQWGTNYPCKEAQHHKCVTVQQYGCNLLASEFCI
jgi:hypothetical protein